MMSTSMSTPADDYTARQIAAIAAAVQAYLDGEERHVYSNSSRMSAWRRDSLPESHDAFTGRHRSWTGRN